MGRVMDVSLFVEADDCGMEAAAGLLEAGMENHCCGDETFTLQGQEDLLHDYQDISLGQQQFFVAFAAAFLPYFFTEPTTLDVNWDYPPPLLVHDVQVWHQVFLI
ncbi:Hypothetical protein I595_1067 [Croceitalea dokdonensis DOKDO 023]|uniref:Uncharacterized protein n=2 Tax=Croceitalea TaxID=574891 RepID=A0A0P7AWY3_9FLAO|nr:Hypothetical protein I595_1067 [Croceitalea dokdonensis DOKDO 023]